MAKKKSPTARPARDAAAAARVLQAISLRKLGATYEVIARECGYANRSVAFNAIQRELQRTLTESASELRALEVGRLDDLYLSAHRRAIKGDDRATLTCLRIMERRAALLGLDTPVLSDQAGAQMILIALPQPVLDAV